MHFQKRVVVGKKCFSYFRHSMKCFHHPQPFVFFQEKRTFTQKKKKKHIFFLCNVNFESIDEFRRNFARFRCNSMLLKRGALILSDSMILH